MGLAMDFQYTNQVTHMYSFPLFLKKFIYSITSLINMFFFITFINIILGNCKKWHVMSRVQLEEGTKALQS